MVSHSGFDKLAPIYRPMENLIAGKLMQHARTVHTDKVERAKKVLMLGEGPGRLLEHLLYKLPAAHFLILDQSQPMLEQARKALQRRPSDASRITWLKQDILDESIPSGPFDLITTPFFLDCFNRAQLETIIPSIASQSAPKCHWLLTDFQIPADGGFRHWRAKVIHRLMYAFFRRVTGIRATQLEDPDSLLEANGFQRIKRLEFNHGLIRSDHWRSQ